MSDIISKEIDPKLIVNNVITKVFTCGCNNGFNWKTNTTYKAHFKSKTHISWETKNQEFDHRKTITRLQNELIKIQLEHDKLKKLYLDICYENLEIKKGLFQ
jgi:arginyl-tRNA--protein-N-Asp/Glu arginylyltransferase